MCPRKELFFFAVEIENNALARRDMEFLFSCSTRCLTSEPRSLVRRRVELHISRLSRIMYHVSCIMYHMSASDSNYRGFPHVENGGNPYKT